MKSKIHANEKAKFMPMKSKIHAHEKAKFMPMKKQNL